MAMLAREELSGPPVGIPKIAICYNPVTPVVEEGIVYT